MHFVCDDGLALPRSINTNNKFKLKNAKIKGNARRYRSQAQYPLARLVHLMEGDGVGRPPNYSCVRWSHISLNCSCGSSLKHFLWMDNRMRSFCGKCVCKKQRIHTCELVPTTDQLYQVHKNSFTNRSEKEITKFEARGKRSTSTASARREKNDRNLWKEYINLYFISNWT